jgi:hypothetical protein
MAAGTGKASFMGRHVKVEFRKKVGGIAFVYRRYVIGKSVLS